MRLCEFEIPHTAPEGAAGQSRVAPPNPEQASSRVEHGLGANPTVTTTYQHGQGDAGPHQLTSMTESVAQGESTTTTFAYDDAGNRTSTTVNGVTQGYVWDAEGELTAAGGERYTYDASGNRMLRESEAGPTVYLPGGQELLITGAGETAEVSATRYYSFAGRMVAMRTGGGLSGVTSFVADHQGSLIAAVPNTTWTSNSVQRIYTDPFGGTRAGSGNLPGDRGFLGAVEDATGLTLLGARYYDPQVGSFISVDPLLRPGVPAHFHAYTYAFNNPVSKSDPSGLEPRDRNGNYDGNPYGQKKPASTSWAALESCRDLGCRMKWTLQFQVNYAGAIVQGLAGLVWFTCSICMAGESLKRGVDFFGDPQGNMNRSAAATREFWSDPWNNFWRPFAEDWANNPGNAWGGTVFTAATVAVPGGGLIRVGSAARLGNATAAPGRPLYRGVTEGHHAFDDALRGDAYPGDVLGHTDGVLHSLGLTESSSLTSWTTSLDVAQRFATRGPSGQGVVLGTTLEQQAHRIVQGVDLNEFEVIIRGVVSGCSVSRCP